MNIGVYNEVNIQHRSMGRRREHVDRRVVSKYREAFDRSSGRADQPCHLACGDCGALMPPPAADPHRDGDVRQDPCRHCGGRAWIDLAQDEAVRSLAVIEAYEHGTIDRGRRLGGWTVRIGGSLAMAALWFFTVLNSYSAIFSALTTLLVLLAIPYFLLGFGHATRVEKRKLPYRWALPLPPTAGADKDGAKLSGKASSRDGRTLVAPLSGRPCLGFVVEVRREAAPGHAAPALLAQDAVDLQVGERWVAGARMRMDIPTTAVDITDAQRETATAYLRQMGILENEGPWVLREGILEAGDDVTVNTAQGGGTILTS